jgi:pepF/M3 family oligoendopeptidase
MTPTRWDLSNIYTGLDDPKLAEDINFIKTISMELSALYEKELAPALSSDISAEALNQLLNRIVDVRNEISIKAHSIMGYLAATLSVDSFNKQAEQLYSKVQIEMIPLNNLSNRLSAWLGKLGNRLPKALAIPGSAHEHSFALLEEAEQSRYMMSEAEEELANELSLSASDAWGNLQGVLTSQKSVEFELDGKMQALPLPALINLRSHPDADTRERAYKLEMQVFEEMKEPLAACMNGIKGEVNVLNRKRGRQDALHSALDMARIDRDTLDAMMGAMQDSLPMFRDYFRAKAKKLGYEKLPWWSLFAPVGTANKTYTFSEARQVVLENFAKFSPEMAKLAETAFDNNWIDAEQRPGKRGGAFCMGIPGVKQSRIMSNFDGSFDQVMTLAHELGHAFHNYCIYQADKTPYQSLTPMTLAETASIMCETIVLNALLKSPSSPEEELLLLETAIGSDAQTIVDIMSRYLFEMEVFKRREKATISADEISEIMLQAQRDTYGDGIDPDVMNKFAWTWKPHYYSAQLSFYNFPYAFGTLFGKGLYAIYLEKGEAFLEDYKALLASTGEASAADLAARFGINIRDKAFWKGSLDTLKPMIKRYIEL